MGKRQAVVLKKTGARAISADFAKASSLSQKSWDLCGGFPGAFAAGREKREARRLPFFLVQGCYSVSNRMPRVLGPQWEAMVQLAVVMCTSLKSMTSWTVLRTSST